MLGVHIDFFEMCRVWFEHFYVRETHGRVVSQGDPQMPIPPGLLQDVLTGRLRQNRVGRVPDQ